jgi:hypothetical protein
MRTFWIAAGAAFFVFGAAAAQAQTKPAHGKCYPDFINVCVAQCKKVGGQPRLCPAYCAKEKRERNCP